MRTSSTRRRRHGSAGVPGTLYFRGNHLSNTLSNAWFLQKLRIMYRTDTASSA